MDMFKKRLAVIIQGQRKPSTTKGKVIQKKVVPKADVAPTVAPKPVIPPYDAKKGIPQKKGGIPQSKGGIKQNPPSILQRNIGIPQPSFFDALRRKLGQ